MNAVHRERVWKTAVEDCCAAKMHLDRGANGQPRNKPNMIRKRGSYSIQMCLKRQLQHGERQLSMGSDSSQSVSNINMTATKSSEIRIKT